MAATIRCPHCGKQTPGDADYCPHCGAVLHDATRSAPAVDDTGDIAAAPPPGAPADHAKNAPGAGSPPVQPWLAPDFVGEDDVPFEPEEDDILMPSVEELAAADVPAAAGRLVSGVQGLLDPMRTTAMPAETETVRAGQGAAGQGSAGQGSGQNIDHLRTVRQFMTEEQPLAAPSTRIARVDVSLWLPWVFALLLAVIGAVVLLQLTRPTGEPREWPGVNTAYDAINRLPPESPVIVYWAYDPASAGEMDLVAAPIMHHLLTRGAQIEIISLLPNGPATARRLLAAMHATGSGAADNGTGDTALPAATVAYRFLPGGALLLPSLAGTPTALAIVLAAQSADAQTWLELVAPVQGAPVVAGVGAGADPVLRPYLDSGQLAGLVSGFDGGYSYGERAHYTPSPAALQRQRSQLVGQNAAALVVFGLIVAGNLVALLGGRRGHD